MWGRVPPGAPADAVDEVRLAIFPTSVRFLEYLEDLNSRGIKYLLSFDGKRGEEDYTVDLPKELFKRHEFIPSGNSTFKKVIDKETEKVLESLYLNY